MTQTTPKQLQGSLVRIRRAELFLVELEGVLAEFEKTLFDGIEFRPEESAEGFTMQFSDLASPHTNLLPDASAIVGDAVNSLRSALDYLVYELAKHNEGKEVRNTQFVIASSIREFESQKKTRLKGLTERQVEMIRNVQPFQGVAWTELLRDISNPDKHRHLVGIDDDEFQILLRGSIGDDELFDDLPYRSIDTGTRRIVVQGKISKVLIMDKFPAIDTLNELCKRVSETVQLFCGDFRSSEQC